jgi:squalene synthase HpnC
VSFVALRLGQLSLGQLGVGTIININNDEMLSASPSDWARLPPAYSIPAAAPSLEEAREYCRRLARSHYENFSVASWFLPKGLQQHFFNVYAYCRISDDLGDEVGDAAASLRLLDAWEAELNACYSQAFHSSYQQPRHPVFVALAETVREFEIPQHEFTDLLTAFRQDQRVARYETFSDVLGYCRNSANPVGHLVLYLCGYRDAGRQQLSDYTCTALQIANFWQDVTRDYAKGRIYLPLEDLRRFGVIEDTIRAGENSPEFREMMRFEVERAREWFVQGMPLVGKVGGKLALDIELFSRGGQEVLNAIERQDYAVLGRRPAISRARKLALVARAALLPITPKSRALASPGKAR